MSESRDDPQKEDVRIGYQEALRLVGLVSAEIYSRFNAMLTANSIIIAIIGWALTSQRPLPLFLTLLLPFIGVILCSVWFFFVNHGVYWQRLFRKEAIRLEEQYFSDTFKLISNVTTESPKSSKIDSQIPRLVRWFTFLRASNVVIFLFVIIYVAMLLCQIVGSPSPGLDPQALAGAEP